MSQELGGGLGGGEQKQKAGHSEPPLCFPLQQRLLQATPTLLPWTYLPLWPNRRKRTQKMMQVTPMWMPMTMPVVDVWLVDSSFRQSHGGLRARGRGRLGAVALPARSPFGHPASGG